ncbi:hypothetical protein [Pyrodictium occultum]|uniref:hypothetical protein n=1 Tax=Pyrodictium occultum TaxID=2309 RepID=UPI001443570D|nr:hypothetical protein [Pyrodictium occultum]
MPQLDVESIVAEARRSLEEIYREYTRRLEEEAKRIVSERLSEIEPVKRKLVEALKAY